jgi:GNAT superfamily N-acetyltransferase
MTTVDTPGGTFTISTDPDRLDVSAIHAELSSTYWAAGVSRETVERSIEHSLCFGLYDPAGRQAGFARLVTDHVTFAWLADVYVLDAHRGLGLGKALLAAIVAHPSARAVRRIALRTKDAHGLYERFGFEPADPALVMERRRPDAVDQPTS